MQDSELTEARPRARKRLAIVVAFGLFLVLQGVYSFATTPEPYPSVRMPSFGASPNSEGLFPTPSLDITVHYADGFTAQPGPGELSGDIRYSSIRTSLDYAFRPSKSGTPSSRSDDAELRNWLRDNASAIHPESEPVRVDFCWRASAIDISDGTLVKPDQCELASVEL